MTKALLVAGTHSGCGKTLVSLALMSALVRRGYSVQAFKTGPDFIDPGHHATITGRPSHNLDGWMLGEEACKTTFAHHITTDTAPDFAIIEGAMGLFDGASGVADTGSSAEIAKWLDVPVLLVADTRSMARSVAALVHGYTTLDADLRFAGVALNRVGSQNHQELLSEAVEHYCPNISLLGCLSRNESLAVPSRHLGLVTAEENPLSQHVQKAMAEWIEHDLHLDKLLEQLPDISFSDAGEEMVRQEVARIGVARDAAFCFYYPDNLRLLEEAGATLEPFSPLHDSALPENLDGLYLGGGYPEVYAEQLSANSAMREAVLQFSRSNKPVYAECGGFMYLMESLENEEGKRLPMTGCFALQCSMGKRFRALGYREIHTKKNCLLGLAGTVARGHEFHYSFITQPDSDARVIYELHSRKERLDQSEGYMRDNTLGSYVHLHFASNPGVAKAFVKRCAASRS